MFILNNFVENNIVHKNLFVKTADFLLSPCRKVFGGKEVVVIFSPDCNRLDVQEINDQSSALIRVLWGVLAVSTIPLAIIASLFKFIASPSVQLPAIRAPSLERVRGLYPELSDSLKGVRSLGGVVRPFFVGLALNKKQIQEANQKVASVVLDEPFSQLCDILEVGKSHYGCILSEGQECVYTTVDKRF